MMAFRTLRWTCALLAPMCLMVLGVARYAAADTISVGWDQSSSTVGYRVHVGVQSGSYSQHFDVGTATTFAFTTATAGQQYCFAVSAYLLSTRLEGPNSNEVCGYSNAPPTLLNPGSLQSTVGQPTSLQLQGSDPQSQPLTYSATGLPPGLSLMSSTGYISGTGTTAGTYTVTARASDGVLSASQTFSWAMTTSSTSSGTTTSTSSGTTSPSTGSDSTRPTVTILSPTSSSTYSYNGPSITLAGTTSDNVGVTQVRWEVGSSTLSGAASGLTNWTASVPLRVGSNTIYITARDAAGNGGIDVITVTVSSTSTGSTGTTTTSDTTAPTVSIGTPTSGTSYSTSYSTVNLTGIASDNSGVARVIWENTATGARGTASGTTSWAVSGIALNAGTNYIEISAYDAAGNRGYDTLVVTRSSTTSDTTAPTSPSSGPDIINPTVTITSPTTANSFSYNGPSITLAGTTSDNVGVTQVRWEVGASTLSGVASGLTNWTASVPLRVGSNTIYITARDAAGNGGIDVITVTVSSTATSTGSTGSTTTTTTSDTTAPTVSISTPTSGTSYSTTNSTINLAGIASDNSGVARVVWENTATGARGTASGTTSWAISGIALNAGTNYIEISAYDAAGNRGYDTLVVTRSSTTSSTSSCPIASTVSICTPTTESSFTTTQSSINMTGTAPSVIVRVVWENVANGARGVASGTTSWAIGSIPLVVGSNLIEVTAYDGAGNPSTDRLVVTR